MKWGLFQNNMGWWGKYQAGFSVKQIILITNPIHRHHYYSHFTDDNRGTDSKSEFWFQILCSSSQGLGHPFDVDFLKITGWSSREGPPEEHLPGRAYQQRPHRPQIHIAPLKDIRWVPLCVRCHITARATWTNKTRQPLPSETTDRL